MGFPPRDFFSCERLHFMSKVLDVAIGNGSVKEFLDRYGKGGSVRVLAGLGTRERIHAAKDLAPRDLQEWRSLRAGLETRRQARVLRRRFRRDPAAYLQQLEAVLLKPALPT